MSVRLKWIITICCLTLAVCLAFVVYLLFHNPEVELMPFTFTSDTTDIRRYLLSFEKLHRDQEEIDDSRFYFFDLSNLSIANGIDRAICDFPECIDTTKPEEIQIDFIDVEFDIYDLKDAPFALNITSTLNEKSIFLNDRSNYFERIANFKDIDSLEEYLHEYLILSYQKGSNLRISTPSGADNLYSISLYSDYIEFGQIGINDGCKIILGFNNHEAYASSYRSESLSLHESCPESQPPDKVQMYMGFSTYPILIKSKNAIYELPFDQAIHSNDINDYLIIMKSPRDTIVTAIENRVDLFTQTFGDGISPDGQILLSGANVLIENLHGDLIAGRTQIKIPQYSELNIENIDFIDTTINYLKLNHDSEGGISSLQANGKSNGFYLNSEQLFFDKRQEYENLRSLAIPVLTTILAGILTFVLGLFIGKNEGRLEKDVEPNMAIGANAEIKKTSHVIDQRSLDQFE